MKIENNSDDKMRRETQIFDFSQFVDVLEAIKKLPTKEDIDKNIDLRIKLLREDIERMEKLK